MEGPGTPKASLFNFHKDRAWIELGSTHSLIRFVSRQMDMMPAWVQIVFGVDSDKFEWLDSPITQCPAAWHFRAELDSQNSSSCIPPAYSASAHFASAPMEGTPSIGCGTRFFLH